MKYFFPPKKNSKKNENFLIDLNNYDKYLGTNWHVMDLFYGWFSIDCTWFQ